VKWIFKLTVGAAAAICLAASVGATGAEAQAVSRKLEAIEAGRFPAGSSVVFTAREINAWITDEARARVLRGARNLRLEMGTGQATGYGDIDFLKLRQNATGAAPGWLLKNLFSGERPVKVTAHFQSRSGRGRVDVDKVEISGVAIEGTALEFLMDDFVLPMFPDAKVSQWFDLEHGVDHFTVSPANVTVVMGERAGGLRAGQTRSNGTTFPQR